VPFMNTKVTAMARKLSKIYSNSHLDYRQLEAKPVLASRATVRLFLPDFHALNLNFFVNQSVTVLAAIRFKIK